MKKTILILLIFLCCCNITAANDLSVRQFSSDPFWAARGIYAIGTTSFVWSTNDKASYIGQLWYPAEYSSTAKKTGYLPSSIYKTDLPKKVPLIASLQPITTGAVADAPILGSDKGFPVIVYSPGLGMVGQAGTFFFEYLASRGYIVAAVNHPGSSFFTEKTDGSLVPYQDGNYDVPANKVQLTKTRAGQLSCVLNALLNLNDTSSSMFFGKMDADHVGVFGHSIGGRSALRAASLDKRFKAAANLDGSMEAEPPYIFLNQEVLMAQTDVDEIIQAELAAGTTKPEEIPQIRNEYKQYMNNFFASPSGKKYLIYYTNTGHMNYTDLPLLLEHPEQAGSADATIALLSLSKLLDDFFNEAFFHPELSLQDNFSKYPYAKLKKVRK